MAEATSITSGTLIAAEKVKGTNVYNLAGDKLGSVDDIMIDKVSGRAIYAVMSFGGFLGMGEKLPSVAVGDAEVRHSEGRLRRQSGQEGYWKTRPTMIATRSSPGRPIMAARLTAITTCQAPGCKCCGRRQDPERHRRTRIRMPTSK